MSSVTGYIPASFFPKLIGIGRRRNFDPSHALAVMLFESGVKPWSIHPTAPASGIYGRMFATREEAEAFARLSADEQLDSYESYMAAWQSLPKPKAANLYQLNFLPASALPGSPDYRGTHDGAVLAARGGTGYGGREDLFYRSNTVLDRDKDGRITVGDLGAALEAAKAANATKWTELSARLAAAGYKPVSSSSLFSTALLLAAVGGAVYLATRRRA